MAPANQKPHSYERITPGDLIFIYLFLPTLFHKTLNVHYLLTNIISQNIYSVCYLLINIISQNIKIYHFFHQGILATKLKYYGYTYGELVEQMLDESAPTPHIDITSSALRLLLNFLIGVLKTKYLSSTKTRTKKVWKAYWYFPLDADSFRILKNPCCISG